MSQKTPFRNVSPYGWWVASYVERTVWDDDPNPSPNSRCDAWENTIVLRAPDREAAYEKALSLARSSTTFMDERGNRRGHWVIDGLTSLLPIYEELEDGAEILWQEHRNRTVRKVQSLVKHKAQLEVFDDTPGMGDGC